MMKKLNLILTVLLCGVFSIQAQHLGNKKVKGNGEIKTITRNTSDYESISVLGNLSVELIAGKEGFIKIQAEENLIEYIKTRIVGDELTIRIKKGYSLRPSVRKRIAITVPFEHINEVEISGSGDVNSSTTIKTKHFSTTVEGSGNLNLNIISQKITAEVAGSGNLKLYGRTDHFEVAIAGSGDVSAYDLIANTAEVSVAGSGNVRLYVNESLDASVAGSGDIRYKGKPMNVEKSIIGSGDITKQ